MATNFQWDPFRDQVYTQADGSPDEVIIGPLGQNADHPAERLFFEKTGSSFTMDAGDHRLTLKPDPDILPDEEFNIEWPSDISSTDKLTQIHIKNGMLVVDAAARNYTEFHAGVSRLKILIENSSTLQVTAPQGVILEEFTSIEVKGQGSLVLNGAGGGTAGLSGQIVASEKSTATLLFDQYEVFISADLQARFVVAAEDYAKISIFGRSIPLSEVIDAKEKQVFTLGRGLPEISFVRSPVYGTLPFHFMEENYPKGMFNFLSTNAGGQFRFVDWVGQEFDLFQAIMKKELVAIDGVPQSANRRIRMSYIGNDFTIRLE